MKKYPTRSAILDKFHVGAVSMCIGATVLSTLVLMKYGYDYLTYVKPARDVQKELYQQELLSEGSHEKILLKDNAPQLHG